MVKEMSIREFLAIPVPLIDVRSPGEFLQGHAPGAVNVPLFSDEERAHVGTVYTRNSQQKAIELAYQYVNPKLDFFVNESLNIAPGGNLRVHCWRGGMRSSTFAGHLSENGFREIFVLIGGYKAYRNHVLKYFSLPFRLNIIGGYTGSGKSLIIKHLKQSGHQVIDLEELANHKGSAFGHIGLKGQPTSEQFENDLYEAFQKLDTKKPIWLEDESRNIGGVNIPLDLYQQMQSASVYFIDIPKEIRAAYLVDEYAAAGKEELSESIRKISRRIGGMNTTLAQRYLEEKKYFDTVMIALHYYDKAYLKSLETRTSDKIVRIVSDTIDPNGNCRIILESWMK